MTISFVTWSVNHVTSLGSSDPFRLSCSVNHVINFVTWSVKTRDQLRDWLTGDDVSIRLLGVMLCRQLYSPQNPTTDKAGVAGNPPPPPPSENPEKDIKVNAKVLRKCFVSSLILLWQPKSALVLRRLVVHSMH